MSLHYCPKCSSTNVRLEYYANISNYGSLPKRPSDMCNNCSFTSESFHDINFINNRDNKIEQILKDKR